MEISARSLFVGLIVTAAIGGVSLLAVPRLVPLITTHPIPTTTPAPIAVAEKPEIVYRDESLGWDWEVSCAPQFREFLAEQLPAAKTMIKAVYVTLVDYRPDSKLPFGTVYLDAQANGHCFNQQGVFACQVAVTEGEPGQHLDAAVTFNTPYVLLDMFLARGPDPNAVRKTWSMATFQPLLVPAEEANRWQSSCLRIWRAQ